MGLLLVRRYDPPGRPQGGESGNLMAGRPAVSGGPASTSPWKQPQMSYSLQPRPPQSGHTIQEDRACRSRQVSEVHHRSKHQMHQPANVQRDGRGRGLKAQCASVRSSSPP